MSRPQTPEHLVQDLPDAGPSTTQMRWAPPTTPPNFSQGRGGAPPLPYIGPPPSNQLSTVCAHSDPSRPSSRYPLSPPGSSNPTFAAWDRGSASAEPTRPFVYPQYYPPALSGSTQPYMHPQYAPGQFIPQYDLQAAHARQYLATHAPQSRPSFHPAPPQSTEYPFDYTQFLHDDEWAQDSTPLLLLSAPEPSSLEPHTLKSRLSLRLTTSIRVPVGIPA
ncbi:hypothetical protein DFH09DRAFT_1502732 [Mycena vulgaris]|nr:hypothetical protein DFH09DRAFT_1502732 [Mycena vulgaris]